MFAEFTSAGTLLTLNLLFSGVALVIGFGLGAWFFGAGTDNLDSKEQDVELQRAAERAMMASQRIQDLAKNIVSDVDAHTIKVEAINSDLRAMTSERPGDETDAVFATIGRMIDANKELHSRLENAEKQIAAQAAELRSYETEARTDSLTGLANRRAFDDEMKRRLSEWQRHRTPFSLLILDIDHFKQFNDQHGHQAGDEVLRKVGQAVVKTARQMDLACRYGGEEFALVLPNTDIQEARAAAERYRKAIEAVVVRVDGMQLSITASIGVARVGDKEDTAHLIRRADEALYKSKEAGRNCGHWHDGVHCLPVVNTIPATPAPATAHAEEPPKLIDKLSNHMMFVDNLQRRAAESQRFGIPLSVMVLRVDEFAVIHEQYGKAVAHLVLESVATFSQSALREMDLLARLGDGELAMLLPGSTFSEANQVAKRLHTSASNCVFPINNDKTQLDVTLGIVELRPNETAELLIARAKAAVESEAEQKRNLIIK
jgi:diguanylate cyclase